MEYKEIIIDHYKSPRNFGTLPDPKVIVREGNASCGDLIEVHARLDKKKTIKEIKWKGIGCAISTAAASLLSEKVVGMDKEDLEAFGEKGIIDLLGGEINVGRIKCATLAYQAILRVFDKK